MSVRGEVMFQIRLSIFDFYIHVCISIRAHALIFVICRHPDLRMRRAGASNFIYTLILFTPIFFYTPKSVL